MLPHDDPLAVARLGLDLDAVHARRHVREDKDESMGTSNAFLPPGQNDAGGQASWGGGVEHGADCDVRTWICVETRPELDDHATRLGAALGKGNVRFDHVPEAAGWDKVLEIGSAALLLLSNCS